MPNQISKLAQAVYKNKYFYPVLIIIGFGIATFVTLYIASSPLLYQIKEGDVSLRAVYAPYDFSYPTTVDEDKTENLREEFAAKILPVYDIDPSSQEKAFSRVSVFFNAVEKVSRRDDLDNKGKLEGLKAETAGFNVSEKTLSEFMGMKNLEKTKKIAEDALENIFLAGIVSEKDKQDLTQSKIQGILLRNPAYNMEKPVKAQSLVDEKEAKKIVQDTLERIAPRDKKTTAAVYDVIKNEIIVNAKLNSEETEKRKEAARKKVIPVYNRAVVKKNELIVEKGQRLSKEHIAKLTQITRIQTIVDRTAYLFGFVILFVTLVLAGTIYLILFNKKVLQSPKSVLLISINAFLVFLAGILVVHYQQAVYLIPLAGIAMILALLVNTGVAFIVSLVASIYIGFMAGGKLGLVFMLFAGSVTGIYLVKGARRRSNIFIAGFGVALMNFFSLAGVGFLNNFEKEAILNIGLYGVANGVISSFIAIGLLPVFEYIFDLVTNIKLLELSDLSNPLLKELTIKAPGTYHHSILVGNLAEEACVAIGANSPLARVGAYYHDIGKIEKAEYFVENQMGTSSKHEKLAPSMSALIITNHTKDGVELAKKYKLNNAIVDFISQHHGTSLIYYFYQRALEKVSKESELKEEEFRYPGPKPQTKEAAVVLLADSVEASSRLLTNPTPARIQGLVQKIINNKFIDGQLEECELTLKDLNKIAESFVRVLTGIFHTRLEYPEEKNAKKEKQDDPQVKDKQSKHK